MGKICKDLFRNFPDFKGIKTQYPVDLLLDFCLETSLTSKGLRLSTIFGFNIACSLETSLTSKGLRLTFQILFTQA